MRGSLRAASYHTCWIARSPLTPAGQLSRLCPVRRSDAMNRMFLEEEAKKVDEAKDAKKPGQEDKTKQTDVKGGDFLNLFGGPHAAGNGEMNAFPQ